MRLSRALLRYQPLAVECGSRFLARRRRWHADSDESAFLSSGFTALTERDLHMLSRYFGRSRGQGLVEYALIIALVAIVVIGTLILLGPQIATIFQNISNNL